MIAKPESEKMFNQMGFFKEKGESHTTYVKWMGPLKELRLVLSGSNIQYRATRGAGYSDEGINKIRCAVDVYRQELKVRREKSDEMQKRI